MNATGRELTGDIDGTVFVDLVEDKAQGVFPEDDGEGVGSEKARNDCRDGPGDEAEFGRCGKAGNARADPDKRKNDESGKNTSGSG